MPPSPSYERRIRLLFAGEDLERALNGLAAVQRCTTVLTAEEMEHLDDVERTYQAIQGRITLELLDGS